MDGLCFKPGINGVCSSNLPFINGNDHVRTHYTKVRTLGRSGNGVSVVSTSSTQPQKSRFSFTRPLLKSLWLSSNVGNREEDKKEEEETEEIDNGGGVEGNTGEEENEMNGGTSWVLKILHAKSSWKEEEENKNGIDVLERENDQRVVVDDENDCSLCNDDDDDDVCEVDEEDENSEKVEFNKDSFSRLLQKVSLAETKVLAKISYLGNLAYSIPKIKAENLLKRHKLRFVTSSVEKKEKKAHPANVEDKPGSSQVEETERLAEGMEETEEQRKSRYQIGAPAAYHIAASAASYLQSHTRGILSFKSSEDSIGEGSKGNAEVRSSEDASFVATSDSVTAGLTAGVSAKEETKRAVVKDLNSAHSSPCAWFICDDDSSATRFFVIQGSESMASWQANLLFEPVQFEGLDVLVHRGIYEAAKGIYEQMLPEVHAHLRSHGDSAKLRFTGHSLGGSLALLVNLMLLIRREAPLSSLLPVVMFGAPSILCGGDQLLRRLGLPRSHVKAITMHRDIVPRAFSCSYPDRVAELLGAVNGNFRNHPCLKSRKMLYTPMGEILILQPEEKFSPHHELLPSGSGLYLLSCPLSHLKDREKQLRAAQAVFFNSPHPLEILSDRAAYGSDGTIYRDHDMYSYLRSVLGVIRLELKQIREVKRKHRREVWWPIVTPGEVPSSGIVVGNQVASSPVSRQPLTFFARAFETGGKSLKRFSRLVASQHMQLFVVLMIPARMLLVGLYHVTS